MRGMSRSMILTAALATATAFAVGGLALVGWRS
jgi:hypothetical protein